MSELIKACGNKIFWKFLFQKTFESNGKLSKKVWFLDDLIQRFFESNLSTKITFIGKPQQSHTYALNASNGLIDWNAFTSKRYESKRPFFEYLQKLLIAENRNGSLIELGCADLSNLVYLSEMGFNELTGLEINSKFLEVGMSFYKDKIKKIKINQGSIEDFLVNNKKGFDTVYTTAVLQHINPESNWVFEKIAQLSKKNLIICESEHACNNIQYPRNYKRVFERFGFKQTYEKVIQWGSDLDVPDLYGYTLRTFEKR